MHNFFGNIEFLKFLRIGWGEIKKKEVQPVIKIFLLNKLFFFNDLYLSSFSAFFFVIFTKLFNR